MCGLIERVSSSVSWSNPSSAQFYELRFMFLMTALRPELSTQLKQVTRCHIVQSYSCVIPRYCPHTDYSLPGGRGFHPHSSLGELPGGAVEGPI